MVSFINIADTAVAYDGQGQTADERLDEWRLQTYYRNLPIVLGGMTVGAIILVAVFWSYFESALLIGWLCMHTAMVGYRAHHFFLFKEQGISSEHVNMWRRQAFLGPLAGGLVWAAAVMLFLPSLELAGRMFLVFIIGGFSAAAVGITSSYLPSLYAWALTAQITLTLATFATATTPTEFSMGLMLTLFTVALLFFGNSSSRSMRQSFIDASQQAALRSEVSRLEATTRSAIENMPAAVALFDADDNLVVWNRRAVKLFPELQALWRIGTPFEDLVKKSLSWRAIGPGDSKTADETAAERLERHQNPDGSWEISLSDGRWLQAEEARMPDGGYLSIYTDITRLKEHESELRVAKDEAERASQAKSQFLALMSHELRTPLNAILGFAEGIQSKQFGPLKKQYVEYASVIQDSGNHLLAVINDILDLSKIEAGEMTLAPEKIDAKRSLQSALRILTEKAKAAELTVAVEADKDLPALYADARAIHQMLLNLLANAIKFTAPGGTITLEARQQGDDVVLCVTDTGIGIAPRDIEAVLRPFGQVEDHFKRKEQGTGLGVPLTKSLMELHGGRLDIFSKLNEGTRMCLVFPPECQADVLATSGQKRTKKTPSKTAKATAS